MSEFNKVITEICDHYQKNKFSMERLAEEIQISTRCLQKWKTKNVRPNHGSMECLYEFLKKNNGEGFILKLKRLPMDIQPTLESPIVSFPPGLEGNDINMIKNTFWTPQELDFLCSFIIYGDKIKALDTFLHSSDIVRRAAFISRWDTKYTDLNNLYGFTTIEDWKKYFVSNLASTEAFNKMGQKALNNLINMYLSNSCNIESATPLSDVNEIITEVDEQGLPLDYYEESLLYDNDYFSSSAFGTFTKNLLSLKNSTLYITDTGQKFRKWMENEYNI